MSPALGTAGVPDPARDGPIAVVAALAEELADLRSRVTVLRRLPLASGRSWEGRIGARSIVLAQTGDGVRSAAAGFDALLESVPVSRLIVIGVSGGLSPGLVAGSVVLADRVVEPGAVAPAPDPEWLAQAQRLGSASVGTVLSSPSILCTAESKAGAYAELGGDRPAVVDLETATFARAAAARGIPYTVFRAVSDTAAESLPLDFNRCMDPAGSVKRSKVVRQTMSRPATIRSLWQLRKRVALCSANLSRCVLDLFEVIS